MSNTGSLLSEVARVIGSWWSWYGGWKFHWHTLAVAFLLVSGVVFVPRLLKRYRRELDYRRGWVSYLVAVEKRRHTGTWIRMLLIDWRRSLVYPRAASILMVIVVVALAYPIQWIVTVLSGRPDTAIASPSLREILGTLFQAHVTVAGVALPILLFFIERAEEEEETRLPVSEVMVRESWISPVTAFALLSSVKIALDYVILGASKSVLLVDASMFCLILILTTRVIFQTLKLSFSRATIKEKGLELVRERAADSAERSINLRLAEGILLGAAERMRVGYWVFGVDREIRERYYVLETRRRGRIRDVNLFGLQQFIDALRFRSAVREAGALASAEAASETEASEPEGRRRERERVFLVRRIGETVSERTGAVLLVERGSVESFEGMDQAYWLRRIFRFGG